MKPIFFGTFVLSLAAAPMAVAAPATAAATPVIATVAVTRDPGDSLYRAAREALNGGDYERAAQLFHEVAQKYPKSALVPDAMYYEAFARYRSGGSDELQRARTLLASLRTSFPGYGGRNDVSTLATRVCGELARQGDATCAATIASQAAVAASASAAPVASAAASASAVRASSDSCAAMNEDRLAALNALLQMDAEQAQPILQKVLARRDACSSPLRRQALFLVSQKRTPETVDMLVRVAQADPDPKVREQAVFWLSQVPGDRTVTTLNDILRTSTDPGIRDKAIFALSQTRSPRANQILRDYALDNSAPTEVREKAIFWLGQRPGPETTTFLQSLYSRVTSEQLKDRTLFALSQQRGAGATWLLQRAEDPKESIEVRKKALFYAGQTGVTTEQLTKLYDSMTVDALREQMIFVLS
ncbi:MAG TPA: HEAT repeat domain-containing protein, partial [Candidatus Elarobacter sp.]|nr:HEAT repeat domain-containing protein [Candidatus Elarobacter sp.]